MSESPDQVSFSEDNQPPADEPQFGAIDIVEAFTAMRHEWRGQTKESRQLGEDIRSAVAMLRDIETKLMDRLPETPASEQTLSADDDAMKLALLIADTDHQLTRAVHAVERAEINRRRSEKEQANGIERFFASQNFVVRWFARPLVDFMAEQRQQNEHTSESPEVEGLNLMLARLRRSMKELNIERIDTQGQPFDASIMNAIGTIESSEHPAGHVAEQFSPGYRRHGRIISFAEVRVSKTQSSSTTPVERNQNVN